MGSCLTISHMCKPCLPRSRIVKALCSMTPYVWANGNSVDGFFDMVSMVLLIGR